MLDLLFHDESGDALRMPPNLSDRRENRRELKRRLCGADEVAKAGQGDDMAIMLPDEVIARMNAQLILEEDIRDVLREAERSGRYSYSPDDELYTAYLLKGNVTFWVDYRPNDGGYEVINAYSHRMIIEDA